MSKFVSAGSNGVINAEDCLEKKEQLLREIVQNVKEGNGYLACSRLKERMHAEAGIVQPDEVNELKFDLIGMEYMIFYLLSSNLLILPRLRIEHKQFINKMSQAESYEEICAIAEESIQIYCSMSRMLEERKYSALTQRILLTVDMDLTKPLTLQFFSESLSVNSSYLSDLFKRELGITITEYVTEKRIEHAKGLLSSSQNSIKMIAKLSGIPDVQYFSKIFKRRTGQTPTQYRKEFSI